MTKIDSPIVFSKEENILIAEITSSPLFSFADWGSEKLESLRKSVRSYYRKKQTGKCAYCQKDVSTRSASNCHIEHILPKSKYQKFMFEPKNLCVVCADCNEIKREREVSATELDPIKPGKIPKLYPRSSASFLVVHPHFDNYRDHISIHNGYYFDKSDKGHFTIGLCKLNRRLREFGWEERIYTTADLMEAAKKFISTTDPLEMSSAIIRMKEILNAG